MSKPARIVLFRILWFLFFLILLAIANIIIPYMENDAYTEVVRFLNMNIILLMIITFVGMINELFWSFNVPFNLIAPVTSGILGIFLINFFYRIWSFLERYLNLNISFSIDSFYILIFFFVMIVGYIIILSRNGKAKEGWEEGLKRRNREMSKNKKHDDKEVEWKDVGKEFRLVFYNIGKGINKLFESKEKRVKK